MGNWFYIAGSLCFLVGTLLNMWPEEIEPEDAAPFGFNVVDGGAVDGGETEWED